MARKKVCDMDCFSCPHPDCINDKAPYHYSGWDWHNRSPEYKEWMRNYQKERRERLKSEGLCVVCAKRPVLTKTLCAECRIKIYKQAKESRRKKKEGEITKKARRELEGRCVWCENPRLPGYKVCKEHLEILTDRCRKAAQTKRNKRGEKNG